MVEDEVELMDEDGWDRKNFYYSFFEEKITWNNFHSRLGQSTCKFKSWNPMKRIKNS